MFAPQLHRRQAAGLSGATGPSTEIAAALIDAAGRQHHRALDGVLQLADVARPIIVLQLLDHAVFQPVDALARALLMLADEVLRRAPECPRVGFAAAGSRPG